MVRLKPLAVAKSVVGRLLLLALLPLLLSLLLPLSVLPPVLLEGAVAVAVAAGAAAEGELAGTGIKGHG